MPHSSLQTSPIIGLSHLFNGCSSINDRASTQPVQKCLDYNFFEFCIITYIIVITNTTQTYRRQSFPNNINHRTQQQPHTTTIANKIYLYATTALSLKQQQRFFLLFLRFLRFLSVSMSSFCLSLCPPLTINITTILLIL